MQPREPDPKRARLLAIHMIGTATGVAPRMALNKAEAAEQLGVSPEFFDQYIAPELRVVKRGRRQLYPVHELLFWLWRAAEDP